MADDVASFLAQRKAKKAGGAKFKTFTASTMVQSEEDMLAGGNGDRFHAAGQPHVSSGAATNAQALVQGEWVDDVEDNQPRLVQGGNQVADLEKLALDEKLKLEKEKEAQQPKKSAYPVREPPPEFAVDPNARPSTNRRAQMDFPALGASQPSAAPPSVWGNRAAAAAAQAPSPREEPPAPAPAADARPGVWRPRTQVPASSPRDIEPAAPAPAAEAKPGVWRPKSHVSASATPSASSNPLPARGPSSSPSEDTGLKKASQPWRPSHLRNSDQ